MGNFFKYKIEVIVLAVILSVFGNTYGQVISAGDEFSVSICADSSVKSWGDNNSGELGVGYKSTTGCQCDSVPVNVLGLTSIVAVASGVDFSIALKSDGTVWSWGWGATGSTGSLLSRYTPMLVNGISNVEKIAVGYGHSLAIKKDGTLWTWGQNYYGELGNGTASTTGCHCDTVPEQVAGLSGMIGISGGYSSSLALKNDGTVWAWGRNIIGELGDSTNIERHSPVQVNGVTGVKSIAMGDYHSLVLKNDGTVWAWGSNNFKELGDSTNINRMYPVHSRGLTGITAIAAGAYYSVALKNDGTVWCYGINSTAQGGNGVVDWSLASCRCDSVPTQVSYLSGITAISAATVGAHSLALKNDGTVWAWGANHSGQLGFGTISPYSISGMPCGCDSIPGQVVSLCPALEGINETLEGVDFTIYPNPFADQTTISFSDIQKNVIIKIIDLLGKEISSEHFSGKELRIEKGSMQPGIYFVQIIGDNKTIINRKIVIQ